MLPKGLKNVPPKGVLSLFFLTRILKRENVFGLRRRERIEVQAILKTSKKRGVCVECGVWRVVCCVVCFVLRVVCYVLCVVCPVFCVVCSVCAV